MDDEPLIIKGLRFTLEQEGYEILTAADGEEALEVFHSEPVDLVLLDVMLPKLDGIQVCQRIRVTKPFNILEVKARIKTVLRRVSQPVTNEEKKIIRVHDMEVNIVNRSVTLGGKEVRLTAKEFDLLQLFITNRGKVFSRETMLETVWKYDYMGDARTVDVHIRRLREKIERNTAQPEFIFTKWGVGYYFTDKD